MLYLKDSVVVIILAGENQTIGNFNFKDLTIFSKIFFLRFLAW